MKDIPLADVRNVVLLGHTGSGKTALVDSILFKLGVVDRLGQPGQGTSAADWTDEEKGHKISIWAKPFDGSFTAGSGRNHRLVLVDTPGYADFHGQVIAATAVADAALMLVDATAGIQVGTARAWRRCEALGLPRGIVISGLDKENANFKSVLESIRSAWGAGCVPAVIPSADQKAVVDVLAGGDAPADGKDEAEPWRNALLEAAAESNDALLEKYLGGEALSPEEIAGGLRGAVNQARLHPVFGLASLKDLGVKELLEGLARLFPSPEDRPVKNAKGESIAVGPSSPFSGLVWRTITDPFVGQLNIMRIYSGTLKADSEIYNAGKEQKERIGHFYLINGKKQDTPPEAHAGDIVALAKLKVTSINDSLCAPGHNITYPPIVFPNPVAAYSVSPKTQGDDDKLMTGLQRVAEEDPTLKVSRNAATHELILTGMGDVQLDVAMERMRKRSHVEVVLGTPRIAYKETVTARAEGHYKHKKQSGGRGQYGEVYLRVEPLPAGETDWFVNSIVGGSIPSNFIPAVQKGLVEGMARGALANCPVVNTRVSVYDGSYHDVDSSEIAFKIASAKAFKEGMSKAKPVLLEPIMSLKIVIPDQSLGDVTGDLTHKRGRILGMGSEDSMQVLHAEAPQAELAKYSSELRSITGGRGSYEAEFARYDVVPANVAQKVIASVQKEKEEEE
jgi:elongation factor G